MQICVICRSNCSDGVLLSNGATYHKQCYNDLLNKKSELNKKRFEKIKEINVLEKKLNTFFNKVLNYFFINNKSISEIEKKITSGNYDLKLIETSISELSTKLIYLYDYWMDYPPDWEERRKVLLNESSYCHQCYRGYESKISLHLHHRIPISKGGNHQKDNLIVLCQDCHQSRHPYKFSDSFKSIKINPSLYEKKLYLIREAIEKKKIISFDYTKYNGEQSSRMVKPEEFKTVKINLCIRGYCYLRKDYRTFAIKRMKNLKIS